MKVVHQRDTLQSVLPRVSRRCWASSERDRLSRSYENRDRRIRKVFRGMKSSTYILCPWRPELHHLGTAIRSSPHQIFGAGIHRPNLLDREERSQCAWGGDGNPYVRVPL